MSATEFITARLDEEAARALAASPSPWRYTTVDSIGGGALYDRTRTIGSLTYEQPEDHDGRIIRHLLKHEADANGAHIAHHDPARVLAQVEAMRQIVDVLKRHEQTLTWAEEQLRWSVPGTSFASALDNVGTARSTVQTLRPIAYALASIWRDHPDYNPA